ncbi:Oidioi.mRNA.OKI2018_I69.PAR.g12631.t1.cds [Oikopleura dioica]|uniref:Oidioi.mRNA.OKI2018_I69.PAR.g12631.t1.cds n=1 Tax=Oikopleura dioica TaxID=34765 RepID=A0ABN7S4A7_OIKDI|nr:Oidioi.mRNA.OKI2018_I69.PAR.g12631.t1.cds [Oikopleura dioica]
MRSILTCFDLQVPLRHPQQARWFCVPNLLKSKNYSVFYRHPAHVEWQHRKANNWRNSFPKRENSLETRKIAEDKEWGNALHIFSNHLYKNAGYFIRQICKKKTFIFREFHTSSFYTFTDQYSQQALEGQKRTFRERKNIAAFIKKEFDKKSRIKLNECCLYQEEYAFKLCRLLQRTFERKLIRRNALERKNQRRKFESSTTQDDFPETSDQYVPMTTILFSPDKDIYEAFNSNIGLWIDPNKVILQPDSGDASIYTIGFDLNINKEVVSKFNFGVKQGDKFVNPVDDLILILKLKNGPDHYITLSGN